LSSNSDAPQVGGAQSDSTRVVKVNRHKTNRRKTRPYCITKLQGEFLLHHTPELIRSWAGGMGPSDCLFNFPV